MQAVLRCHGDAVGKEAASALRALATFLEAAEKVRSGACLGYRAWSASRLGAALY